MLKYASPASLSFAFTFGRFITFVILSIHVSHFAAARQHMSSIPSVAGCHLPSRKFPAAFQTPPPRKSIFILTITAVIFNFQFSIPFLTATVKSAGHTTQRLSTRFFLHSQQKLPKTFPHHRSDEYFPPHTYAALINTCASFLSPGIHAAAAQQHHVISLACYLTHPH